MGLLDILRSGSKDEGEDSDGRPPKPDPEQREKTVERTRYTATVEYRNGDTEQFECYGIYSRGEDMVKFNTDPYGKEDWYSRSLSYSYDHREIHYETLSREPIMEEVATDRFVATADVNWVWERPNTLASFGHAKDWREGFSDISLEVIRDVGTSDA